MLMRGGITAVAFGVATAHLIWPDAKIDSISVLLLVVAVLPWLQPLFKSVELPGGLKVEFHDVQKVSDKARAAGLLDPVSSAAMASEYSFQTVSKADPNLALAGLRIELEKRLQGLAEANGYDGQARGIGNLLRHLQSKELLSYEELGAIRELVDVLNEAVHGATVDPAAAELALDFGVDLLQTLESRIQQKVS
jgi:hypothetical protein